MFVILWEFEVKPGSEDRFLRAYGPGGDWVQLFQRDPHYRGNSTPADPARPLCYFTIDFWDSEDRLQHLQNVNREVYDALNLAFQIVTT